MREAIAPRCATCGRELAGDRDDDPTVPTCGECVREDELVQIDLLDGELDGLLG